MSGSEFTDIQEPLLEDVNRVQPHDAPYEPSSSKNFKTFFYLLFSIRIRTVTYWVFQGIALFFILELIMFGTMSKSFHFTPLEPSSSSIHEPDSTLLDIDRQFSLYRSSNLMISPGETAKKMAKLLPLTKAEWEILNSKKDGVSRLQKRPSLFYHLDTFNDRNLDATLYTSYNVDNLSGTPPIVQNGEPHLVWLIFYKALASFLPGSEFLNIQLSKLEFKSPAFDLSDMMSSSVSSMSGFIFALSAIAGLQLVFLIQKDGMNFLFRIAGLSEITYWGTNILWSLIDTGVLMVIVIIVYKFMLKSMFNVDFFLLLTFNLLSIIGVIMFTYAFFTFVKTKTHWNLLCVLVFLTTYAIPYCSLLDKSGITLRIFSFIHPAVPYCRAFSVFGAATKKSGFCGWRQFNHSQFAGEIWGTQIFLPIFYSILFWFFELNNSKLYGPAPIGWRNLFRCSKWRRLFARKRKIDIFTDAESGIKIEHLMKVYKSGKKETVAVNDLCCEVKPGETIIIIGANGSGKTTLIGMLTGAVENSSGSIMVNGDDLFDDYDSIYRSLGYVAQENIVLDTLTVTEHFYYLCTFRGIPEDIIRQSRDVVCDMLGLSHLMLSKAKDLSGGEKRKLNIAMALVQRPLFLIFDEPTAGVDVQSRQIIWQTLHNYKGTTSLISSHSLEDAESAASRIFTLSHGNLLFQGTPAELRKEAKCGYLFTIAEGSCSLDALLDLIQEIVPEAVFADNSIWTPVDMRVVDVTNQISQRKNEIGLVRYSLRVENLEDNLIKLIQDDECA